MKKIILAVLLLSVMAGNAQNFEGVITWKITSDITDPKVKAQMEEAQKKMNDPATKAQMKEMEEKMNDPQFKAMMEANPQMKAQMEAAMKMMQGGGDLNSMMPKGFIIKMKNQNVLTSMDGGMMANTETLYLNDKKTAYQINREAKTYSVLPQAKTEDVKDAEKVDIKVTKTSETTKVLGYTCTKYVVESKTQGHSMQQNFWTTTAIKDFDFKSLAHQRMGNGQQSLFYDQIEGVPLKMEMMMPQGKMVMEVTELKKQSLSSGDFAIPSGYKEVVLKY
ncbi:MAG: hypothetical protein C0490_16055 [Marivirga sp.]|nr:hypothetical protein [Marivirga sp.]